MFNLGHENRSRSPPHQPRDALQNDERPLPFGWKRRISNNVDPGRVYYANGRQRQWKFPTQEQERLAHIQRVENEYQARIELAEAERQAEERRNRIEREESERRAEERRNRRIGGNLLENLELIINNNAEFTYHNMVVLGSLRHFIQDNGDPIDRHTVSVYISDLLILIRNLKDPDTHSDLKSLCEKTFEQMFEKLAKEKQLIDSGRTRHNERDTANIIEQLNGLNSIYISFMKAINNIP